MPTWNSGVTWSSGSLWGPAVLPPAPVNANTKSKPTKMRRQPYYPKKIAEQPEWHSNMAEKCQIYMPALGFSAAEVDSAVADNLILAYGLGNWISNVRDFAPSCTSSLKDLIGGTGVTNYAFPVYAAPALPTLPAGITGVLPGALERIFRLVQSIKSKPGYTEAMGIDMGIVGSEAPAPPPGDAPPPRLTVLVIQGSLNEAGRIKFFKDGHMGIWLECRRNGGAWEYLTATPKSPYIDDRPLLVAGQPEVREYRARFWDDGVPNGDWCDVAKVTVGP